MGGRTDVGATAAPFSASEITTCWGWSPTGGLSWVDASRPRSANPSAIGPYRSPAPAPDRRSRDRPACQMVAWVDAPTTWSVHASYTSAQRSPYVDARSPQSSQSHRMPPLPAHRAASIMPDRSPPLPRPPAAPHQRRSQAGTAGHAGRSPSLCRGRTRQFGRDVSRGLPHVTTASTQPVVDRRSAGPTGHRLPPGRARRCRQAADRQSCQVVLPCLGGSIAGGSDDMRAPCVRVAVRVRAGVVGRPLRPNGHTTVRRSASDRCTSQQPQQDL